MTWKNTDSAFGLIPKLLHWVLAFMMIGLIALGWWMVGLSYYDAWYNDSLYYHKALGILLFVFGATKILWLLINPSPKPLNTSKSQRIAAKSVHYLFYLSFILLPLTGYVISTSAGDAINVLSLFEIPSIANFTESQRDLAIAAHYYTAYGIGILVILHILAAIKHQWINKDNSISRML